MLRRLISIELYTIRLRKMKKTLLLLITLLSLSCSEKPKKDWKTETPTFNDFETSGFCDMSFRSTNPNFENSNIDTKYKAEVIRQFKKTENYYNCNYIITPIHKADKEWELHIFNAYNGEFVQSLKHQYGAELTIESSLIILDGMDDGTFDELTQFWIMENDKMIRIK